MKNLAAILFLLVAAVSCKQKPQVSEEKPYTIKIAEERSYYHAERIRDRLKSMDMNAYIVTLNDSANKGKWYNIFVDAVGDVEQAEKLKSQLKEEHNFEDISIMNYDSIKSQIVEINTDSIKKKEIKWIKANKPDIDDDVFDVVKLFPQNNMFYVQKLSVFSCPESSKDRGKYSKIYDVPTDLPRGVTKTILIEKTKAFAEAIYKDNIYGDRVTIDVAKLKDDNGIIKKPGINRQAKAGLFIADNTPSEEDPQYVLTAYFADLILNTGDYLFEDKSKIKLDAYGLLKGYKVSIEPKENYYRTYIVLTDPGLEYLIFCQSIEKEEEILIEILADCGKSDGMLEYNEFYNTFYTLPDKKEEEDIFVTFYVDRLDWSYAKSKGYTRWSKELVGHWSAHAIYYNNKKGVWSMGIFDLLTDERCYYVESLYKEDIDDSPNVNKIDVYGISGSLVTQLEFSYKSFEFYSVASEINFKYGRYMCMIDNTKDSWLNKEELKTRAEALQLVAGGYQDIPDEENKDGDDI